MWMMHGYCHYASSTCYICVCLSFNELGLCIGYKCGTLFIVMAPSVVSPLTHIRCPGALIPGSSSFSRMLVMNHNWSATKRRLHPQRVAEISRHSILSGDRIRRCGTSSESHHKDTDQCL